MAGKFETDDDAVPGDVREEMRAVCRLLDITLEKLTRS